MQGSDPDIEDEGKLVYSAEGLPEGATLEGTKFSWTPTFEQSGNYDIMFIVSDAAMQAPQNAKITVNHVNRSPVLNDIAKQSVIENAALNFVVSGSDPDKGQLAGLRFQDTIPEVDIHQGVQLVQNNINIIGPNAS